MTNLEIVCVLPHVHADDGDFPSNDRVLILGRNDAQPEIGGILYEPSPAAALDAEQGAAEGLLEPVDTAPGLLDLGAQRGRGVGGRLFGPGRGEVQPEERVVDVTAAIELDCSLQGDLGRNVTRRYGSDVGRQGAV